MASLTYYGHVSMTYPDYIDTATGKTLVCQPGQTYSVIPASGNVRSAAAATPTDGRFASTSGREAILRELDEPEPENPRGATAKTVTNAPDGEERAV